ncbi:MAG: sigma-70 family RNA polymerase sigma factor [Nakamurella sp.]
MTELATEPAAAVEPADSERTSELAGRLEEYRRELAGYCYRMLGSTFETDDAVQETMVRAWRALGKFDGRSSLRTWLYRIATNVCLDLLNGRNRRALPMDLGPASPPVAASLGQPRSEAVWIQPVLNSSVLPANGDPADLAVGRDTIRLAFIAALQHLPPRQRAVLILREVLRWSAIEAAELLDTTVASVNSALQRARATISSVGPDSEDRFDPMNEEQKDLLARYLQAFTAYDIESLVALLQEEATASMPPFQLWLQGRADIGKWHIGPGHECNGSVLVPLEVNGSAAFAHYKPAVDGHKPFGIQVLELTGGQISKITYFLDTDLFRLFGLPERV